MLDLEAETMEFFKDSIEIDNEDFDFNYLFNMVTDLLAASPMNIIDNETFETFKHLIAYVQDGNELKKLSSVYFTLAKSVQSEIEIIDSQGLDIDASEHKQVLYHYMYLLFISVHFLVPLFTQDEKNKKKISSSEFEKRKIDTLTTILSSLLGTFCELLNHQLSTIIQGEQELIEFCDVVLKSAYVILMSKDTIKEKTNKSLLVRLLCTVAKNYQQNDQVSHRLTMALPFSEHLADPIAEIISTSVKYFDNRNFLQNFLLSLSTISPLSTNLAKNISILLVKLSEYLSTDLYKFMNSFEVFEKSSPTVRAATMICYGNCVSSLSINEDLITDSKVLDLIENLVDTLETNLLDTYQIVRQRCLQALELIISNEESKLNFKKKSFHWILIANRHLEDKSSFVRKSSISFLKSIIKFHPFTMNGGKLSWDYYWNNYIYFTNMIKEIDNGILYNSIRRKELDDDDDDLSEIIAPVEDKMDDVFKLIQNDSNDINDELDANIINNYEPEVAELVLKRKYCRDACIFIKLLDKSFILVATLLNSKLKSDNVSAIEFFTVGDAYEIASSKFGIKQMLHLIWKSGSNEDGNKVVEKLIEAYVSMFLTPDPNASNEQKTIYIALSLIKLTYNCSLADLISLEKMIVELCKGKEIEKSRKEKESRNYKPMYQHYMTPQVINVLWNSFINAKHPKEKKGAIIILGMIAIYDYKVINIEMIINHGMDLNDLNVSGRLDDSQNLNIEITKFSCIALRRSIPKKLPKDFIYPNFSVAIEILKKILLWNTVNGDWYNLAEEVLNTLYEIDINSDDSSSEVLKQKSMITFGDNDESVDKTTLLSQLLFLAGHIGLKTIIFLEKCEAEFKKKKQETENNKDEQEMELDLIGGTNEDDFTDTIQNIKERELLYGKDSILSKFVPLIIEIITKPKQYKNKFLQRQATLCFAKFMCISPRFCETHLGLYISLMKKSSDSIVRSNLVLGLGDVAVCFTNIIDENKSALYSELHDRDLLVQRTCLMTVTFLILAGQIKVKGQLSQLAKLLVHEDKGLREMSKLFFQELATKDNAIYNGFIEMLSGLNLNINDEEQDDKTKREYQEPFSLEHFKEVIKFVLPFINKDKQRNFLIKKLDSRLEKCTPNEGIRYAFCIKELIRRDDFGSKKDSESEKSKYYKELLEKIARFDRLERLDPTPPSPKDY